MEFFVNNRLSFSGFDEAISHIGEAMLSKGVVKESYPEALKEREEIFPTGIALEKYAVAIPHCAAEHANSPAIYLIRPSSPVQFNQADDDGMVGAVLIFALIVTDPADQLELLKSLFTCLQRTDFIESLLAANDEEKLITLLKNEVMPQGADDEAS